VFWQSSHACFWQILQAVSVLYTFLVGCHLSSSCDSLNSSNGVNTCIIPHSCVHIANANKSLHIKIVNERLGLFTPTIVTPMELTVEGEE
jgi:hypothetical protein